MLIVPLMHRTDQHRYMSMGLAAMLAMGCVCANDGWAQNAALPPPRAVKVAEAVRIAKSGERVKMLGTLFAETAPGFFFFGDETGKIRGRLASPIPMRPGDRIEVAGTLELRANEQVWLDNASAVNLGSGSLPAPIQVRASEFFHNKDSSAHFDAEFVSLRGRVTGRGTYLSNYSVRGKWSAYEFDTLTVDDDGVEVLVFFQSEEKAHERWPIGTLADFTGTLRLDRQAPADSPRRIHLVSPGPAYVQVIQWPPFWQIPRYQRWVKTGLLTLTCCIVASGVWIWLLQRRLRFRRVAERTFELECALAKERELGEMKSNFVSLVSHELRTPLGVIMSASDVLQRYFERLSPEKRMRHLDMILRSTRNLASLIEEVLILGRVEEGRMQFAPSPLDLEKFCRTLCDEMRSATKDSSPIQFRMLSALDGAVSDESLLRHIICNLLSNAVKYSEPGSPVEFTVERRDEDVVFTIKDQGIGIPEEDQARLFTSFTRAGNVGMRPGTGLGLVVVLRCVQLHGGTLKLDSTIDEGTTISVTLPVFNGVLKVERSNYSRFNISSRPHLIHNSHENHPHHRRSI
ncbi:hypothetical protein BH11VER1_BH11VER1_33350 [soil metagenome]